MLLLLRKVLFYILAVVYLFLTPYIIFHALGYGIDPQERELFKTGLISIVTVPKGANVFVEGKKFASRTPASVSDLLPGNYHVRLTGKKIEPWEKEIKIESEKATRLEPVVLLPRRAERENISERAYWRILPADFSEFKIYALEKPSLDGLWKHDLLFRRAVPSGKKIPGAEAWKVTDFKTKSGSSLVLFKIETENSGQKGFLAYDLDKEKKAVDLSVLIPQDADHFEWDVKNISQIYFLSAGRLYGIDLKDEPVKRLIAAGVMGYGVKHNRIYVVTDDFLLQSMNLKGENQQPLIDDPAVSRSIFNRFPVQFYRIEVVKRDLFQRDLLLFLGEQGTFLSSWLPYDLAAGGVLGFKYAAHSDEEKALFWTKTQIGTVDFTRGQEGVIEKGPVKKIFYDKGLDIQDAFWAYEDSHIVFVDHDKIYLLEASGDAPYLVRQLDQSAPQSAVLYAERNHTLYLLDRSNWHLVRRKITD